MPQAPRTVISSGFTAELPASKYVDAIQGELRARYLGSRYGAESRSAPRLRSHTVWDMGVRYTLGSVALFAKIENLFDTELASAEFLYESRLPGEPEEGVLDRHFTPGNDRNLRIGATWSF